ncbi:MAG: DUF2157 domain-containing protein [Bacteroidota bacterium]|nr:DUF2157 domain-containing protein [Bacteroidota bacterium]
MNLIKDIPELVKANVISQEIADNIQEYYKNKGSQSSNRLVIAFGILGAIMVGLGIILIIAHNWDELSRPIKTSLAFLPLLIGQVLCVFALIKKRDSMVWRESTTTFLFFTVGSSISLISQIYHMPGNLSSFLFIWMLLCFPLMYIMQSSMASLLYLIGICFYSLVGDYWTNPIIGSFFYWFLLLMALPYYYLLFKKNPLSNFMIFHNWIIPLSIAIVLGTIGKNRLEFMYVAYFSLFGLFYMIGNLHFFKLQKLRNNGYFIIGSLGTIGLLFTFSFDWFWKNLRNNEFNFSEALISPELYAAVFLSLLSGVLLYFHLKNRKLSEINPLAPVFILFIITFIIGLNSLISAVLINLIIFTLGLMTIRIGAKQDHLGVLNFGLLIITVLVVCRFFDTDLSFVLRGILFVTVGSGLFATNYWMLKKRKINE